MKNTYEINLIKSYVDGHEFLLADQSPYEAIISCGFIAGGAIRAAFAREEIKDVDVFFTDIAKLQELANRLTELGFNLVFQSSNAQTLRKGKICVQLINKEYATPYDCIDSFDYTVTQAFLARDPLSMVGSKAEDFIHLSSDFLKDLAARQLVVGNKLEYPLSTAFRLLKYLKRGYTVRPAEMVKLLIQCAALNPQTLEDWKKHLFGIDMIILNGLFSAMEQSGVGVLDAQGLLEYINSWLEKQEIEE